jgi:hypothetical protein
MSGPGPRPQAEAIVSPKDSVCSPGSPGLELLAFALVFPVLSCQGIPKHDWGRTNWFSAACAPRCTPALLENPSSTVQVCGQVQQSRLCLCLFRAGL